MEALITFFNVVRLAESSGGAANAIAANAVFWLLIGQFLATALSLAAREIYER